MKNITARKLYQETCHLLMNPDFLENLNLDKTKIKQELEGPYFIAKITHIAEENDYSCEAVYELVNNLLTIHWGAEQPHNPLFYIYQFTLSFSFPSSVEIQLNKEWDTSCLIYLNVLKLLCDIQKQSDDGTLQSKYPLEFLTTEEMEHYKVSQEYRGFVNFFNTEFIYEMMKLNQEVVGHNTLDHICGVHHLALHIGKQLFNSGIPIDLGRVSGAAAGHDLGKFGCKSWESKRVAYLHYYYTDLWFKNHGITYIGHIALNHSVWDLELENLSIESLILIYSDFRVKNIQRNNQPDEMEIFSLQDSFQVILDKLDNVDEEKERRYRRVYTKLKDFEDYIINLGLEVNINNPIINQQPKGKKYYSLMTGDVVTEHIKYLSINHNINLMYKLRDESSLNEILEIARSETDPKTLREYLDVFYEYSTYLTQKQKIITLRFLYEQLIHQEEDIRRQCAEIMGILISMFDEDYRKEIPEGVALAPAEITSHQLLDEYLHQLIFPDHKMIPLHRSWVGYNMQILISSLFQNCQATQIEGYKKTILKYYKKNTLYDEINIYLLEAIKHIPMLENEVDPSLEILFSYIEDGLNNKNSDIRISALDTIYHMFKSIKFNSNIMNKVLYLFNNRSENSIPAENYLKLKLARVIGLEAEILDDHYQLLLKDMEKVSDIFLSNLKTATNWVTKKIQVEMLLESFLNHSKTDGLYTTMHFCNLLKVSAVETVRNRAGKALVDIFPHLPIEQRNDIAIELLRALEIEGYQFTKYIPDYLGQILIFLQPYELDEILNDLIDKIKQSNLQINSLLLKTVGILISNYSKYQELFPKEGDEHVSRLKKMLGILLNGLVHDELQIKQISFSVIGKEIFASKTISLEEKHHIFQLIGKKVLTLLTDTEESDLLFLTNSAGLNNIYRFISEFIFLHGSIKTLSPKKVAFFPGTFDPFTLGHKEITKAIRDYGFEVYLAVDEFSWSKRTQPNLIRKKIIHMSIADEMDIHLYPEDFPTNIGNSADLKRLQDNFPNTRVYIVAGSDVLLNASAYKAEAHENSIHSFSHIVFERSSSDDFQDINDAMLAKAINNIHAPVIRLNLPPQYEDISSTQIRTNIDENRDISKLIDPLAQRFIYENSLYRKEPQYKSLVQTVSVTVDLIEDYNEDLISSIVKTFHEGSASAYDNIKSIFNKPYGSIIAIRDINEPKSILSYSIFHWVPSDSIYTQFENSTVTEYIRRHYSGRIIMIDGIFARNETSRNLNQIILTETISHCLKNDYSYGVYQNSIDFTMNLPLQETIELHGFVRVPCNESELPIMTVNMSNPCTLSLDLETIIKEPFRSNSTIQSCIKETRSALQRALTNLYPGNLVLSFDRNIIDETLVRKICDENDVSPIPSRPRQLGDLMCVPFGNILNRMIVPNTITKSLHTEKMFTPDLKSFTIGAYPYYLDLKNQMKMIRSFSRPVILVDDLLNKGYRFKALDPLLKSESIDVKKIIVGILSGRGKELMEIQNRKVDCAYFIPKLRLWFNENLLYPFIGGDTLWRGVYPEKSLLSSINLIFPYTSPAFIHGVTNEAIYDLSEISILNAIKILEALEIEYQRVNERKLTLSLLGEVILYPRCPDQGKNMHYDLNLNPSSYLKNDLELLRRLKSSIISSHTGGTDNVFLPLSR
ncbi:cytidyltransferase [Alkaliphilus peptidifermentans]|uniref:nicotinate-nucleotide adenylyltransferase n=1 Tax=Alkaliphilus peptidifermentans DSM 18978 TaxID=1120976 RepID=A0A1G5GL88_9FIRM|nr:cytidyltransferase [Alkaliphilus peptidifermentans]SCY51448.1 Nicotinic acid mononucleotide adenylyltransferase [Alkaliphilus peptidifermentans DSM 18978]